MLCETNIILQNIPSYKLNARIFHKILSIPHNIVMDPNNVKCYVPFTFTTIDIKIDLMGNENGETSIYYSGCAKPLSSSESLVVKNKKVLRPTFYQQLLQEIL